MSEGELKRLENINSDYYMMVSQEISTSLNGIVGALNLIKNHEHSASMKDLVESLDSSVSRLEKFTFKFMLSNQLNLNLYKIKLTDIILKDLIHYSILDFNEFTRKNNIKIKTDKLLDITLQFDEDLIFKSFNYVLENAIKFSPKNGTIEIKTKTSNNQIICSISDSGPGFSKESLVSLFQSFPLYENNISTKGLSLYLVRQIMELHHGAISIYNKTDSGACVDLIFNNEQ